MPIILNYSNRFIYILCKTS